MFFLYIYFIVLFRCIDGTGQLNFGFAADAISNNDHFLTYSLGPPYNGMGSIIKIAKHLIMLFCYLLKYLHSRHLINFLPVSETDYFFSVQQGSLVFLLMDKGHLLDSECSVKLLYFSIVNKLLKVALIAPLTFVKIISPSKGVEVNQTCNT